MPTYEYACTECGERTEMSQRIGDDPLKACPICGGAVKKLFHTAGIVFKGSGFYSTDSRSKPKKPAESKKSDSAKKSSDKKDGGSAKEKSA